MRASGVMPAKSFVTGSSTGFPAFLYQLVKTFFVQRELQAASQVRQQEPEGL